MVLYITKNLLLLKVILKTLPPNGVNGLMEFYIYIYNIFTYIYNIYNIYTGSI